MAAKRGAEAASQFAENGRRPSVAIHPKIGGIKPLTGLNSPDNIQRSYTLFMKALPAL